MLKDHLYQILNIHAASDQAFEANILLNSNNSIFLGHFPEQPILPGVCMMAIVKELLEFQLGKKLYIQNVQTIKFLNVINPNIHASLQISINSIKQSSDIYVVNSQIFTENITFFKMNGSTFCSQLSGYDSK